MPDRRNRLADRARLTLGIIRLINGALGIVAPGILVRRLGTDPSVSPAALYAFRLFGVRTVLLAAQLVLADGPVRDDARRTAVIVHASDTTVAAWGAWRREIPLRAAIPTVVISAVNTVLAVLIWPKRTQSDLHATPAAFERGKRWRPLGR